MKTIFQRKANYFHKVRTKLYLAYIISFGVIILLVSVVVFTAVKGLMIQQLGATRVDVLKQIGERANTIKNSSITISNLYRLDDRFLAALRTKLPAQEEAATKAYLNEVKKNYNNVFKDVGVAYDVVVVGNNGFCYSSQAGDSYEFDALKKQLWYHQIYDKDGKITFISSFRDVFGKNAEEYVFSASRTIKDYTGREYGTLLINIEEKYLADLYASTLSGNNNIYIIDKKGNIVSHPDKSMLGLNFIGVDNFKQLYGENSFHIVKKLGMDYLLSNYYDEQTEWTIIEEIPGSLIFANLDKAYRILLISIGVCLMIALGVSYYMSRSISRPLLKLCNSMDRVKQGDFDVISDIEGYVEINQLKDSFNEMAREIKRLLADIKQEEFYKRKTELDFLRAQINPHFLYNTLFSIQCLTEIHKNEQAVYMMSAFIDLLKMTLSLDTDLISLETEFSSTEKYLILQQIRYGEKVHYVCELDEDTKTCMVPALIIQPIVENAIFHGLEAKEDADLIVLESRIENGRLLVSVTDDGIGMGEKTIQTIMEECRKKEYKRTKSIGIANVSNRIKMNFGEEYGIHITSEIGIGTTVTIDLPVIWEKQLEGNANSHENTNC